MTRLGSIRDTVRAHTLFSALDEHEVERVLRASRQIRVDSGAIVVDRGEIATSFLLVLDGEVDLVLRSRHGDTKVVETLQAGHSFGETLMFDDDPRYPMTAIATQPSRLLAVDGDVYRPLLELSPATCLRLLSGVSRRVHALVREVEAHTVVDVRSRLVRHVLDLAKPGPAAQSGAIEVTLPEPKHRIAARLGVTPETLSRTFRSLHDAGLVAITGRSIRIFDLDRLRAVA